MSSEATFTINDIQNVVRRNLLLIVLWLSLGGILGYIVAIYTPKRFKATAELNIQAGYFHNPMVNDIITEVQDPSELNAQKATLMRIALNDGFIDQLGEKYGIYTSIAGTDRRTLEREEFLKKIEYYSQSATSYFIAVHGGTPAKAFGITTDIVEQITSTFKRERLRTLEKTRNAIQTSVESLGLALRDVVDPFSEQRKELEKMEVDIKALATRYTDRHPDVVNLRKRADALRTTLSRIPPVQLPEGAQDMAVYLNSGKASTQDIHHELLKKLSYLNVVLEMESDESSVSYVSLIKQPSLPVKPYFPSKRIFLGFGAMAGLFLGAIGVVFRELQRGTFLSPDLAAETLGVAFLGSLPKLEVQNKEEILLLESPRRLLPYMEMAGGKE